MPTTDHEAGAPSAPRRGGRTGSGPTTGPSGDPAPFGGRVSGSFRIAVTQGEGLEGSMARALTARGAEVLAIPAIAFASPDDFAPLDRALSEIERFDWIVFTSRHAVEAVIVRPAWGEARMKALASLRVAAIGKATARVLTEAGVSVDLVPDDPGARALADLLASLRTAPKATEAFAHEAAAAEQAAAPRGSVPALAHGPAPAHATGPSATPPAAAPPATTATPDSPGTAGLASWRLAGVRVLWPRSDIARAELPESLRAEGAEVVDPLAYRTVLPAGSSVAPLLGELERGGLDAVVFMSPSSARNLAALLGWADLAPLAGRCAIASIGPTTSAALRELGAPPAVESAARTADDLADTLLGFLPGGRALP